MKKKCTFNTMLEIFDNAWNGKACSAELVEGWRKELEDNGWTDEEFDKQLGEKQEKESKEESEEAA